MPKTKSELSTAVARRLGIVDAINAPSSVDAAYIEGEYDMLFDQWVGSDRAYWTNTDRTTSEIPDMLLSALVDILTGHCAPSFGVPEPQVTDEDGKQLTASARGWRALKRLTRTASTGEQTEATFY